MQLMMGYVPKYIKKSRAKKKKKYHRTNIYKNKLTSKLNPSNQNGLAFLLSEINSTMSVDNSWKSNKIPPEWLQKHNVVWWKSKCIALENENRILREKLRSLTESTNSEFYSQTVDDNNYTNLVANQYDENNYDLTQKDTYQYDANNYDYSTTDVYQCDQTNYDCTQNNAYEYDENNYDHTSTDVNHYTTNNYEFSNNDDQYCDEEVENNEDDLKYEVDENMMKYLEQSFCQKMKLKSEQKNMNTSCNGEENNIENLDSSTSNNNSEVNNTELLYGSATSRIIKMEKVLQMSADRFRNFSKPHYWPNIPFHF